MSAPVSEQDACPIAVEEDKVCSMEEGIPVPCDGATSSSAQAVELCTLSGDKPFFDIILSKSHVKTPYLLSIPAHIIHVFPRANVLAVVTHGHGDRTWNVLYVGKVKKPRFDYADWRNFVNDNNLKYDDACIFEVLESTNEIIRLKVLILRDTNALPPELKSKNEACGKTLETAIELL